MVVGIILAAGQSKRMGETNKLTEHWRGKPLIRHVFDAAVNSSLDEVIVVTGHEAQDVEAVLPGARFVHNEDHQSGMGSSIVTGVKAINDADGVMILLGDMPLVTSAHINALLEALSDHGEAIVVATNQGKPGNPVLFGKVYFSELEKLEGDRGARKLIEQSDKVIAVEIGEAAARDFDNPEAFAG